MSHQAARALGKHGDAFHGTSLRNQEKDLVKAASFRAAGEMSGLLDSFLSTIGLTKMHE